MKVFVIHGLCNTIANVTLLPLLLQNSLFPNVFFRFADFDNLFVLTYNVVLGGELKSIRGISLAGMGPIPNITWCSQETRRILSIFLCLGKIKVDKPVLFVIHFLDLLLMFGLLEFPFFFSLPDRVSNLFDLFLDISAFSLIK